MGAEMTVGYLRSCAGCSAHLLLNHAVRDRGEPSFCPKCSRGLMTPEEQLAQLHPRVSLFTDSYRREYVVNRRDGDRIWVRPLGRPDLEWTETTIHQVRPRFSYAKLGQVTRGRR